MGCAISRLPTEKCVSACFAVQREISHCRLDTALFGVEHAISAQGGSWWDLLICHSSCRPTILPNTTFPECRQLRVNIMPVTHDSLPESRQLRVNIMPDDPFAFEDRTIAVTHSQWAVQSVDSQLKNVCLLALQFKEK